MWNVKDPTAGKAVRSAGINRNIVECKEKRERKVENAGYGINRNIVECKVPIKAPIMPPAMGINRNIVECKERYNQAKSAMR